VVGVASAAAARTGVIESEASKRWTPIATFSGRLSDAVLNLHRHVGVAVKSLRAWMVPHTAVQPLLSGNVTSLRTQLSYARFAHLPLPDAEPHAVDDAQGDVGADGGNEPPRSYITLAKGAISYRFTLPMVIEGLRLMWSLKNAEATPLSEIAKRVWRMTLPRDEVRRLEADLASQKIVKLSSPARIRLGQSEGTSSAHIIHGVSNTGKPIWTPSGATC
jgi:hypothetical protein